MNENSMGSESYTLNKGSVLIVDDDAGLCELISQKLQNQGYDAEFAVSAEEAYSKLLQKEYDLLLLDFYIDEITVTSFLDNLPSAPVPFVVMTGYAGDRGSIEIMQRGALDFILKDDAFFDLLAPIIAKAFQQIESNREHQRTRQAWQASLQRFNDLVQYAHDPVFIVDKSGKLLQSNQAYNLMFDQQTTEKDTDFDSIFVEKADYKAFARAMDQEGQVVNYDVSLIDSSGSKLECQISAQVFHNSPDGLSGYQGFIKEISERKRYENLLKKHQTALERKNVELEESVQALKTFSDSISNDLRTPIWRIDGFCNLLSDKITDEDAEVINLIRMIRGDGKRITQFINDAFRLSNISRGELDRTEFNLISLIKPVLSELANNELNRVINIDHDDTIAVRADQRQVLIMMRLLLYYLWFYAQVTGCDSIILEGLENNDIRIRLSGNDLQNVGNDNIFVPLYQSYLIKDYFQTGVSLVTVQRVLSLHGGRIWTDSQANQLDIYFNFG
jgi:PAS domain S-box-containing protein